MNYAVKFGRSKDKKLALRYLPVKIFFKFFRLNYNVIRIFISRTPSLSRAHGSRRSIIRNIDKHIRIFFYILRIKKWMNACHKIHIIIGIMYKNHIRTMACKVKVSIRGNWYICRIQICLIMHIPKTAVRPFVKIGNRNHISVAIRIRIRRLPYTFQAIPHTCLIWKENCFQTYFHIFF